MFEELQEKEEGKGGGSITSSKEVFNICQFLIFFFFESHQREKSDY